MHHHHHHHRLLSANNIKDRWSIAKQLLHSSATVHSRTTDELDRLCTVFAKYLIDTISNLKRAVVTGDATLATS